MTDWKRLHNNKLMICTPQVIFRWSNQWYGQGIWHVWWTGWK